MPISGLIFICIGTILMGFPFVIIGARYGIPLWKRLVLTPILTVVGVAGTYLMYWVENGEFAGTSFYGAVFLVPILFVPLAYLFRIPCRRLLDLCALGEGLMLTLMRVHCLISGCCRGRTLCTLADVEIHFPSQIVEGLTALAIVYVLWRWTDRYPHRRGHLYGWYLVLYGTTRFLLNFLRAEWQSPDSIPLGTVWSAVAMALGALWLWLATRSAKKES